MRQPDFTLTAGPTMASHRVLTALGSPVIYDYDPAFLERFRETEEMLRRAYRTSGDVVLMQGEAVLGLEAAARGLVSPGMRCLNLVSGVYAAWFGDWLREYGADVVEVRVPYDEAIDPSAVASALDRDGPFALVAIVHSETPSGIENPLREIAALVHAHGALMLADVVSSLGGSELAIDDWHIDLAVAGPQKCLAGPPGMSLVCGQRPRVGGDGGQPRGAARLVPLAARLEAHAGSTAGGSRSPTHRRSVTWAECTPRSPSSSRTGSRPRSRSTTLAARATRAGVLGLGLELWPREESYAAHCVTAVRIPAGTAVPALLGHIRERYGVMLSGGHGELKEKLVRLGHMGPAARSLYPLIAVSALGRGLADLGVAVDVGAGAAATMGVLSAGPALRLAPFRLHRPASVEEATAILDELGPDALAYCGGTELLLIAKLGLTDFTDLVDVKPIDELGGIEADAGRPSDRRDRHPSGARAIGDRPRALALARGDGARRRQPARAQRRHDRRQPLLRRPALRSRDVAARRRRRGQHAPRRRSRAAPRDRGLRARSLRDGARGRRAAARRARPGAGARLGARASQDVLPGAPRGHRGGQRRARERPRARRADRRRLGRRAADALRGGRGGARRPRCARSRRGRARTVRRRRRERVRPGRRRQRLGRVQAPARARAHGPLRAPGARARRQVRVRDGAIEGSWGDDVLRCPAQRAAAGRRAVGLCALTMAMAAGRWPRRVLGERERSGDRIRARGVRG